MAVVERDQPPRRAGLLLLFGFAAQEEYVYERGAEDEHEGAGENAGERDGCEEGAERKKNATKEPKSAMVV